MAPVICLFKVRPNLPPFSKPVWEQSVPGTLQDFSLKPGNGAVVIKMSGFNPRRIYQSISRLLQHHRCTNFLSLQWFVSTALLQVSEKGAVCSRGLTKWVS